MKSGEELPTAGAWEDTRGAALADLADSAETSRVDLGSGFVLLFAGSALVRAALLERLRAERLTDPEQVGAQAEAFAGVTPGPNELMALLLIDVSDPAALSERAEELEAVAATVVLELESARVPGRVDDAGFGRSGAAPLRFVFDGASRNALTEGSGAAVVVEHPVHRLRAALRDDQVHALRAALDG